MRYRLHGGLSITGGNARGERYLASCYDLRMMNASARLRARRRLALYAWLILTAGVLAGCASSGSGTGVGSPSSGSRGAVATTGAAAPACSPPYPIGAITEQSVFCADPAGMQAARVIRIVDGDTLHVDLGGKDQTVRLYGINATEVGQPCSAEATRRLTALAGAEVRLLPDARDKDKYQRLLRYVYSPAGLSIDAELVDEGLAHAWRSDGNLRFAIIGLETRASGAHRGCLWP